MKILLTGATGFIGTHLRAALLDAGHTLLCISRQWRFDSPGCQWAVADFAQTGTAHWMELLRGVDAVVNAAGVFREQREGTFAAVHGTGPRRLYAACVHAGVQRVVHFSVLGAESSAGSGFHASKRMADDHVLSLPLDATVLQPSLVFGFDGPCTRALLVWASLPLMPLPAGGRQMVQPVHVADVADAVLAVLRAPERWGGRRIALVGPVAVSLRDYLQMLRAGLGLPKARTVDVPVACVPAVLRLIERWPLAPLEPCALAPAGTRQRGRRIGIRQPAWPRAARGVAFHRARAGRRCAPTGAALVVAPRVLTPGHAAPS